MKRGTTWFILLGSFVIYLFDALEIAVLSFALPAISAELGLTPLAGGLLATATLLGMGCSSVITGWLADNRGRRVALIVSMVVFVALTSALFVVPNYGVFVALRFLAGIGLGGVWSVLSTYIVESWPPSQRGRAVAFVLAAYPLGGASAALIAGFFMPDWRLLFLVTGLSALVPLLMVVFFFPESKAWLAERAARSAAVGRPASVTARELFTGPYRRRTIIATLVAVCAFIGFYGASTWLPSYLSNERGLDPRQVSLFMTVLNLGMFLGYLAFGWVADKIGRRNAIILSLAGTGVLMPLYGLVTHQAVLLWMGPLYAFFMTFAGLFGSYLGELYPTRIRTTGAGFCFNIGRGVAAFAPLAMGGIAASWGFSSGLILSGAVFLLGACLMFFLPQRHTADVAETYPDKEPATHA
ncbi:MFS transporter [Paenarthrobacter sp. NPDC090520]|uniref:MFS transporter n=1 Tax=Paenarthrobacter sp. NPDC090520 TaxID=3364382 RepID=UPI0038154C52